jgi:hypothetical protein
VTPFKLASSYEIVPRTLPRLRFGDRYGLRARAVDLAGISVAPDSVLPDDQSLPATADPMVYRRYEPLTAPILVPREDLAGDLGASLERMVIRSRNKTDADDGLATEERTDRHVLPPRASMDLVERHGMLDGPTGVRSDAATYKMLTDRDAAELPGAPHPREPAAVCPVPYLPDPLAERTVVSRASGLAADSVTTAGQAGLELVVDPDAYPSPGGLLSVPADHGHPSLRRRRRDRAAGRLSTAARLARARGRGRLPARRAAPARRQHRARRHRRVLDRSGRHPRLRAAGEPGPARDDRRAQARHARGPSDRQAKAGHLRRPVPPRSGSDLDGGARPVAGPAPGEGASRRPPPLRGHPPPARTHSPTATSRFRECFPTGTDVERTGPSTDVDVPSSARPAAPQIRYVVPALQWERTCGAGSTTSLRRGGLLRILLERPWFSSGDGELLGVALWSGDVEPTDEERKGRYFSQWGLDPIWSTRPDANKVLKVDQFPDHASDAQGLTLPDGNVVDVAGFPVHHDEDRDLWFADVRVELPQTYAPFVRLALCRYQPCALPDSELSKTTLADVAQLLPERSVTILVDPADARRHQLVVAGIGPSGPERNEVSVKVQQRDPVVTGNLGWNDAPGAADVIQDAVGSAPDTLLWSGTVVCHAPGDQVRVVVREDELLPADPICVWLPPEGSGNLRALIDARLAGVQEGRLARATRGSARPRGGGPPGRRGRRCGRREARRRSR